MAKKSKHMSGQAFSVAVCDAIRHHVGEVKSLESKRSNAFDDRDAAIEELGEMEGDSDEAHELKCRHSDAIVLIDALSSRIKWHRGQIEDLVEKADEPSLDFMYEMPAEPPKKDPKQGELKDVAKDARPVGRPGKPKPEAPDPSKGDGVDEHLAASVNELDMPENLKGKLIAAGLTTVGRVAAILDDEKKSLLDEANLNQNQTAAVTRAVKAFRKDHRQAAREAEGAVL